MPRNSSLKLTSSSLLPGKEKATTSTVSCLIPDTRIISILSRQYIEYLTGLINFITKTSLLSKKVMEAPRYVQKLRTNDIFLVYEQFDKFITFIMNMFENREFCKKTRLFQNFVYMLFLDLIKIYNVFYIMTTEILDRFKRMSHKEMEKAFAMYKNFINFTTSVKKEANTIPLHFGFVFKAPNYYTPDPKLENSLKRCMEQKEAGVSGYADEDLEGFDIPKEHNFADYDDDYENRK